MKPTGPYCFGLFHSHDPKTKAESAGELRQNQDKVRHVQGIGIISFGLGDIQM